MHFKNYSLVLLGVPLSNLTMDETVERILELIELYKQDLTPRYVATLNTDFLVHAHLWNFWGIRFPELLHVLRQASLVTIDGMPIFWSCRILGSHPKARITGVDLLPRLVEKLNEKKKSLFFLGGSASSLNHCIAHFQTLYPTLKIAGSAHPIIDVEGQQLENAETRDALLVELIHRSKADVLLINLGNPKQEIWFERIRKQLRIPISIGVGGSFDLLSGAIRRAPLWMQHSGLEWIFRLCQEPRRLWKRYLVDIFKFSYMMLPLLFFHTLNRLLSHFHHSNLSKDDVLLFISQYHTLALVTLPNRLQAQTSKDLKAKLTDFFNQDALIFDFKNVHHLDLEGIAFLLYVAERAANKEKKPFFLLNLSRDIKLLLKLHRVWDALVHTVCNSPRHILMHLNRTNFYHAIHQEKHVVKISFFGKLDHENCDDDYLKNIQPILFQKECHIDFSYCTYIDNTGFQFLLKFKKIQDNSQKPLRLTGLSKSLKRQFEIAKLQSFLTYEQPV